MGVTPGTTTRTRGDVPMCIAAPSGPRRGAVVVVQEAFGVTPHIEEICARLASAGYLAVAPHLFWRAGDPVMAYDAPWEDVMQVMATLTGEGITEDVDVAFAELAAAGVDAAATGIIGFCMGGTVALVTAARLALGAAVTFYGGGIRQSRFGGAPLVEQAPHLRTPWLGLYGDLDGSIPVEQVEALRIAADSAPVSTEVVRYADAGHGFHCDARASYHAASARDAWDRMVAWLDGHLAPEVRSPG